MNKEESGDIEENQGNNAESGSSDTSDDKKIGGNSKETNDKNVSETKTIQSNQSDQSNQDTQDKEILIIIDQTEKPTTGNSFDFFVNKAPEGYNLVEMQWLSEHSVVKNTIQEAVEHGSNGEDGFYISGNGQYSGFIYPDNLKGEKGKVLFLFRDEHGNELTWEKEITL
ncbi:hypothetical protein BBD40_06570 [Paenibacillus ihbetae]|uniref:DUF4352 domain-containing protein n=1 Tax=Paenibacillus ihbetae TaxID=1870820 RepID=A0ABX3K485_9BACL|nr:hypothetical protein BBD40_06570 [Paenibacillus ihbetae]